MGWDACIWWDGIHMVGWNALGRTKCTKVGRDSVNGMDGMLVEGWGRMGYTFWGRDALGEIGSSNKSYFFTIFFNALIK